MNIWKLLITPAFIRPKVIKFKSNDNIKKWKIEWFYLIELASILTLTSQKINDNWIRHRFIKRLKQSTFKDQDRIFKKLTYEVLDSCICFRCDYGNTLVVVICTLRKLYFHFLSNWMGYDRGDGFPFDFVPNWIPFGSWKLLLFDGLTQNNELKIIIVHFSSNKNNT